MLDTNALADLKAKIKRTVRRELGVLPVAAQADIIADLRLELAEALLALASSSRAATKPKNNKDADASLPLLAGLRHGKRSGGVGARKNGKPATGRSPGEGTGPTAAIYNYLKAHPKAPIVDLMKAGYPDDQTGETHKARAVLFSLKQRERVRNVGHGLWEVTDKE
jgi:hypothetical protein